MQQNLELSGICLPGGTFLILSFSVPGGGGRAGGGTENIAGLWFAMGDQYPS